MTLLDLMFSKSGNTVVMYPCRLAGLYMSTVQSMNMLRSSQAILLLQVVLLPPHNVHFTFFFLVRILFKAPVASHV